MLYYLVFATNKQTMCYNAMRCLPDGVNEKWIECTWIFVYQGSVKYYKSTRFCFSIHSIQFRSLIISISRLSNHIEVLRAQGKILKFIGKCRI